MPIRANELRTTLSFQRIGTGVNEYGEPNGTWAEIASCKGKVERVQSVQETLQALQVNVTRPAVIQCRWQTILSTLKPSDRIVAGAEVFDIKAVIPKPTQREVHFLVDQHE
jgi:head-tail adaptor